MQTQRQVAAKPQAKPIDLGCESADKWLLPSTATIAICYYYLPWKVIISLPSSGGWKAESIVDRLNLYVVLSVVINNEISVCHKLFEGRLTSVTSDMHRRSWQKLGYLLTELRIGGTDNSFYVTNDDFSADWFMLSDCLLVTLVYRPSRCHLVWK